jgi:hypothetical protein
MTRGTWETCQEDIRNGVRRVDSGERFRWEFLGKGISWVRKANAVRFRQLSISAIGSMKIDLRNGIRSIESRDDF